MTRETWIGKVNKTFENWSFWFEGWRYDPKGNIINHSPPHG